MKWLLISLFLVLASSAASGQDTWSLQRCVEHALENSLAIENSKMGVADAEISSDLAWQQRLPQLNGSTGYNLSFGRRIDPSTNDFINQRFGNQTLSVSGGVVLYNGGRVNNQIKSAHLEHEATKLDLKQLENDISLQVASTYLNILFARENAANADRSLELTLNQLEQTEKLIAAGSRPRNAALELLAQKAAGEQAVVAAQNDEVMALLTLKQLMQLDADVPLNIEVPPLSTPSDYDILSLNTSEIYRIAESNQPNIQAGALRAENAEIGVLLAKSNMMPSLSIGGGLGSNYSTAAFSQGELLNTTISEVPVLLNNEAVTLGFLQPNFDLIKQPYFDQLNENFGYQVGASLNIPIFNQGFNKRDLERSKLQVRRTQINNEQIKNDLRTTIERAVTDVKAAKLQYDAAVQTLEASDASYSDTQKRFDLGVSNTFELTTAINNRDRAQVDVLIAKYDFIFKTKVLDFYQGKTITLD